MLGINDYKQNEINNFINCDKAVFYYGLHGKTKISDKLIGFSKWEYKTLLLDKETSNVIGFTGIDLSHLGSIDYGKNYTLLYDISSFTKVIPRCSNDISDMSLDNISSFTNSMLTYRNSNVFGLIKGLNFAIQYQGHPDRSVLSDKKSNNGYGASISYNFNDYLTGAIAYTNNTSLMWQRPIIKNIIDYNDFKKHNNINYDDQAFYVGLKYDQNNIYLAAIYGETNSLLPFSNFSPSKFDLSIYDVTSRVNNTEVVAQYTFDCGISSYMNYLLSRGVIGHNDSSINLIRYLKLGLSYQINPSMLAFINYRFNILNSEFYRIAKMYTGSIITLGISYKF
ncbi:porin [Candidatus Palibaumannia cicadellinicola]|nr:porin [Candidatus Baumannia cicadellinicola]